MMAMRRWWTSWRPAKAKAGTVKTKMKAKMVKEQAPKTKAKANNNYTCLLIK